jgi:hypothetical protein
VDGGAARQRGAAGEVEHVVDVLGAHDPLVVDGEVREQVVAVVVLQVMGADQVVVGHAADREERHTLESRVEQAVGEVDRARARGGEADPELAREPRIADRRHRPDLLVADVDVAQPVLPRAERLHEPVDPVAREAEDGVDAPFHEAFDEQIRGGVSHAEPFRA